MTTDLMIRRHPKYFLFRAVQRTNQAIVNLCNGVPLPLAHCMVGLEVGASQIDIKVEDTAQALYSSTVNVSDKLRKKGRR
jgi:hypothetical protein